MIACTIPEAYRPQIRAGGSIPLTLLPPVTMVRRKSGAFAQQGGLFVCAGDDRRHLRLAGTPQLSPPPPRGASIPPGKKKFLLTACILVEGVDDRIPEWIEYHRLVGIEHFYVYDNSVRMNVSTTTATHRLLHPYIEEGLVTYVPWPARILCFPDHWTMQLAQQNSCMRRFGNEAEWMAHLDTDEFMVPRGDYKTLPQLLEQFPGSPGDESNPPSGFHAVTFGMHYYGPCVWCRINCSRAGAEAVPPAGPKPPPYSADYRSALHLAMVAVYGKHISTVTLLRASKTHLCGAAHNYHQNKVRVPPRVWVPPTAP